jgi:hypothetical protein
MMVLEFEYVSKMIRSQNIFSDFWETETKNRKINMFLFHTVFTIYG